jgi:hypothetical protein
MGSPLLRAVLAVYTGLLLMPIPWLVVPDAGLPVRLVGFGVGAVLSLAATHVEDPVDPLRSWAVLGILLAAPLVYLVPLFDLLRRVGFDAVTLPPAIAIGATVPALFAGILADEIHQQRRIEATDEEVRLEVRVADTTRRLLVAAIVGVGMLGLTLAAAGTIVFDRPLAGAGTVGVTVLAVVVLVFEASRTRTISITDQGLIIQGTLFEWEAFEDVVVTDCALVLRRPAWWEPDLRYDLDEETSPADVRSATERHRQPAC